MDGLFHGTSSFKWMMTGGSPMTQETPQWGGIHNVVMGVHPKFAGWMVGFTEKPSAKFYHPNTSPHGLFHGKIEHQWMLFIFWVAVF